MAAAITSDFDRHYCEAEKLFVGTEFMGMQSAFHYKVRYFLRSVCYRTEETALKMLQSLKV